MKLHSKQYSKLYTALAFISGNVGIQCPYNLMCPYHWTCIHRMTEEQFVCPRHLPKFCGKNRKATLRWLYTRMKLCMQSVNLAAGDLLNVCSSIATGTGNVLSRHGSDQNTCSFDVVHDCSRTGVFWGVFQVIYHAERL